MPLFRSRLPITTIEPCLPSFAKAPPTGPDWIHEIKHDGFRIVARRDGKKVRLISRKGKDLTYRFPLAAQAIAELPLNSCIIDGEAIISDATGLAIFSLVRSYRNGPRDALCVRPHRNRRRRLAVATDRGSQGYPQEANWKQASRHRVQQAFRPRRLGPIPSCL
jgi:ATP dependent DNA ligase domain